MFICIDHVFSVCKNAKCAKVHPNDFIISIFLTPTKDNTICLNFLFGKCSKKCKKQHIETQQFLQYCENLETFINTNEKKHNPFTMIEEKAIIDEQYQFIYRRY
jgi:hypothetical protein